MATFIPCSPAIGGFPTIKSLSHTKRSRGKRFFARKRTLCMAIPTNPSGDGSADSKGFQGQASGPSGNVASLQDEIRLLLDPTMPPGVKQVLVQDLAKRFFGSSGQSSGTTACKALGLDGVSDVIRQFQEDILPDLLFNGPRYVSKAAEELPKTISRITNSSDSATWTMPTSVSAEEVQREFRNIFNRTPEGLFTPSYKVLAKFDGYEIRQYPTLIIAETPMNPNVASPSAATEVENATAMGQSFNNLAGFLFGKNESKTAMKMTTPVILSKGEAQETMSFIIGEYESVEDVPKSLVDSVSLREQEGQIFAVSEFSGYVTQGEAKRQREKLIAKLSNDGVSVTTAGQESFKCMVYNGPNTLPNLRRNEMMIEVMYAVEDNSSEEKETS